MIRITSGDFKGMKVVTPKEIRPTEEKVRQALFNILAAVVPDARVLDGYCGSGALGIEALSRGAAFVTFIDNAPESIICVRDNLENLGQDLPRSAWRVMQGEVLDMLPRLGELEKPFDLIILDPPYDLDEPKRALIDVDRYAMLTSAGILAIEHHRRVDLPPAVGKLKQLKQHRYGETVLSFYQATP